MRWLGTRHSGQLGHHQRGALACAAAALQQQDCCAPGSYLHPAQQLGTCAHATHAQHPCTLPQACHSARCALPSDMLPCTSPRSIPEGAMTDYNYFMDTQRLRIAVSNMRNANSGDELERIKAQVLENLCRMPPAPSVQFHEPPPKQVRTTAWQEHACSMRPAARLAR